MKSKKMLATCHDCDLAVTISSLHDGEKASCPRCGYTITRQFRNAATSMAVFSATAIIALFFANLFTFIGLSAQGNDRSLTLLQSIQLLFSEGEWILGLIILLVIIVLPLLFAVSLNLLLYAVAFRHVSLGLFKLLRLVKALQHWNMAEIYFLAVLVSIIKVVSLADINLGPSFWFFGVFCLAQLAAMQFMDSFQFEQKLSEKIHGQMPNTGRHHRKIDSMQRSWLFLLTGILFYIPANVFPIMTTTTLGHSEPSTIAGGVILLWEHGSYPIALVIFIASVAVPIGKFLVLLLLLSSQKFGLFNQPQAQMVAYRVTEFIGRWSMLDVFVVAFLAGLIQIGGLMAIYPGPAVLAFAGMVVVTMLAAENFEPKMFWDKNEKQ